MAAPAAVVGRYDASFKNVPGKLTLTATHIAWVPDVSGTMDRQQQNLSRVTSELRFARMDALA